MAELFAQARNGTRMAVRTGNAADLEVTKLFSLSGFTTATREVFISCGYNPDPITIQEAFLQEQAVRRADGYAAVDATIGEEFNAITTAYTTGVRVYSEPASGADDYIEVIEYPDGAGVQILRRFRVVSGNPDLVPERYRNLWTNFWYLVQLPNGQQAWVDPGVLRETSR